MSKKTKVFTMPNEITEAFDYVYMKTKRDDKATQALERIAGYIVALKEIKDNE